MGSDNPGRRKDHRRATCFPSACLSAPEGVIGPGSLPSPASTGETIGGDCRHRIPSGVGISRGTIMVSLLKKMSDRFDAAASSNVWFYGRTRLKGSPLNVRPCLRSHFGQAARHKGNVQAWLFCSIEKCLNPAPEPATAIETGSIRAGTVNMSVGIRSGLLAICAVLMMALPANAEDGTFADLLARAKAQAAAGRRWAPPGDNMTETVIRMMDLIPLATPAEIAALSELLENEKSGSTRAASKSDELTEGQRTPVEPGPATSQKRPALAIAAPVLQAGLPDRSTPAGPGQVALGRAGPDQTSALFETTLPTMPPGVSDKSGSGDNSRIRPSQIAPGRSMTSRSTPGQSVPGQGAPDRSMPSQSSTPSQITPSLNTRSQSALGQAVAEPGSRAAVLYARGLDAETRGDLSGARRFYFSAAQQGDAAAARSLGRLYDPAYIKQTALGGIDPDSALAQHWYERALTLGDVEAGPLLEALSLR
jgi:hypothetical protein